MPFPDYFNALIAFLNSHELYDLVTIMDFDRFILDKKDLINECPSFNNHSRILSNILVQNDVLPKIKEFVHDVHRQVCSAAELHLFLDNLPTTADDITIDAEAVLDTFEPAGVKGAIQVGPHSYLVKCSKDVAINLQNRVNNMKVGDNIITATAI